jgi:hypothetical protein
MCKARSFAGLPKACAGLLALALATLISGPTAKAQTVPMDPNPSVVPGCADTVTNFPTWFQGGTVAVNGVVNPADSLHFPGNPNCDFYKWSEQMFLWLTSPAPAEYGGGGGRIFDSPVFFDVSPPDSVNHRTLIAHSLVPILKFNLRATQVGAHGLPVILDKAGKMHEVELPLTGVNGRPLVLSSSGRAVEVQKITVKDGKAIFLDQAGKAIPRTKPLLRSQFRPQFLRAGAVALPIVQKFVIGGSPIFVDPASNVVEVEQGQAGDNAVLESQGHSLVYYGIHVNDVYAYFLSGVLEGKITPGTSFPTTEPDLAQITSYASARGVTFPDSRALAVESKTSWVEASTLPDSSTYITRMATIPVYKDTSDPSKPVPNQWTPNGTKTALLALVGIHVVGSTAGHPEMIWATFEHVGNTPNDGYQYVNTSSAVVSKTRDTSGTWLFSASGSAGPFNVAHMSVDPSTGVINAEPGSTISPSDTIRSKAWGAACDPVSSGAPNPISCGLNPPNSPNPPNPFDSTSAASNSEIIAINNSVRGQLLSGDIRMNYIMTGATWTPPGGTFPSGSFPSGSDVGTSKMANTTMETYQQGDKTFATGSNCFDCHSGLTTDIGSCPAPPSQPFGLSHISPCIQQLSSTTMSVHITPLQVGLVTHKIEVTVTTGTGTAISGATVTVTDPSTGFKKTSGTTSAAGTVTLSYPACFEVITFTLKPIRVHIPCNGTVQAPEFPSTDFDSP